MNQSNQQDAEILPKEIIQNMKTNIFDNYFSYSYSFINKDYLSYRSALFEILHKISINMGFKSQTFFLCAHYLDIIFSKKKKVNSNLNILGLASLCIAAKFCENDPIVPYLQYFIKMYNNIVGFKHIISIVDLMKNEVLVLKILNYKLNYFTIYDFNSFLFGHGILKIEQLKDVECRTKKTYRSSRKEFVITNNNSVMVKNLLEQIYKKSRYYIDVVVNKPKICLKYNSLYISIYIMKKSVEEVLAKEEHINLCKIQEQKEFYEKNNSYFKQIMFELYEINYEMSDQYLELASDNELRNIFEKNDWEPAPPSKVAKNEEEVLDEDIDENLNINNEIDNKNKFNNTFSVGFYKKLQNKSNTEYDINKNKNQPEKKYENYNSNKTIEKVDENMDDGDIDENLNINEIQNWNYKKDNEPNKIGENIPKGGQTTTYNPSSNKQNKYFFSTYKESIQHNNTNSNLSKRKAYSNNINYNTNYSVNSYKNNSKSIALNKDKSSPLKLENNTINNSYSNYTRMKKYKNSLKFNKEKTDFLCTIDNNSNIVDNLLNNTKTNIKNTFSKKPYYKKFIPTNRNIDTTISRNTINISSDYSNKQGIITSKRKDINNNMDELNPIIATTSSRFGTRYHTNKLINKSNISKDLTDEINDTLLDNKKKEIESYIHIDTNNNSSRGIIPSKIFKKRNHPINIESAMNNTTDESKGTKGTTSFNFYRVSTNKILVNTLKEANKNSSILNSSKDNSITTNSKKIYQSIRHKYKNLNKTVNHTDVYLNPKIETESNHQTINEQSNQTTNSIRVRYSMKTKTEKNDKNDTLNNSQKSNEVEDKANNKKISTLYKIINKTKTLFSKRKKSNENDNKEDKNKKNDIDNFYKSQQNFYTNKNNNEESQNSTIVINNNININIGNKTHNVSNDFSKYKKVYQKNPEIKNINKNIKNNTINTNNVNNKGGISGMSISNILNKFPFYRKTINKKNTIDNVKKIDKENSFRKK